MPRRTAKQVDCPAERIEAIWLYFALNGRGIIRNDNEPDNSMDGFQEIPTEEMEQLGLPEEWLKQK